jgi:hypothetical protein
MEPDPALVERRTCLSRNAHNLERIGDRITDDSIPVIFMTAGQMGTGIQARLPAV